MESVDFVFKGLICRPGWTIVEQDALNVSLVYQSLDFNLDIIVAPDSFWFYEGLPGKNFSPIPLLSRI